MRCPAGCDATLLCAKQPALYYGSPEATILAAQARHGLLCDALPGLDVNDMIEEDPKLLFLDIEAGLQRFRELWDVDAEALRNSETFEVALAIRALSESGPPSKF